MTWLGPGAQSETGMIRSAVLKHPKQAWASQEAIDRQWKELKYLGRPEMERALEEYERFAGFLEQLGVHLHFLPQDRRTGLDSIYVRDTAVTSSSGIVLCNMGKEQRVGEPAAAEAAFRSMGLEICGSIRSPGLLEGGDVVWIDPHTLAVGLGYRTNEEGIRQLRQLLKDCVEELLVVPLPHWRGPGNVFHLMSILSPLANDLALVFSPLLPAVFRQSLLSRGIRLVEVDESEFESMACNVLALAPRRCLMLEGNPETRRRLESEGVEVFLYAGEEISRKGAGGPTCLTRPLARGGTH